MCAAAGRAAVLRLRTRLLLSHRCACLPSQGTDDGALDYALNRALDAYYNDRAWFHSLQKRVMLQVHFKGAGLGGTGFNTSQTSCIALLHARAGGRDAGSGGICGLYLVSWQS